MVKKLTFAMLLAFCSWQPLPAEHHEPQFSTAGFYALPNTGRTVFNMNPAWRFYKGKTNGAEQPQCNDSNWELVALPHGIETLPTEASGCTNYQGEIWYRKHFTPEDSWKGKRMFLHFEAIMGKSKIWVNGKLLAEHLGGYLPVIVDVSSALEFGKDNVITVWADNSNDPSYPPGKAQDVLDFTYSGGIYRDCWMVVHNPVHITDPNYEHTTAGGGVFVAYDKVSDNSALIRLKTQIRNTTAHGFKGKIVYELYDKTGEKVLESSQTIKIPAHQANSGEQQVLLKRPHLWSPDDPHLYQLRVYLKDQKGKVTDGLSQRIGIRSIEFKGKDGFWLNGKPYPEPLIGANRHQDFAVIGNALSNSLHWRDAKKLRDAGLRIIRNAHYPQDPAFMDACDELGLFVIVNTPGWQFWNNAPQFAQLVYQDIRNMVRRDRNRASVWLWEPILNETYYPEDFAQNVKNLIDEEYPYPYCYSGCDAEARGHEYFPVQFTHPYDDPQKYQEGITYFTREWGDNVDDWNSHNSPSRVARNWGEVPMLVQAKGYARPDYPYTCYDRLYRTDRQHVGGCLWHSFDHQRGYHPDPFYGGIMDAFRQPKTSYYMFCAQRPDTINPHLMSETGPMVHIAHILSPFSPKDVTVYSNCEEVRLTYCKGGKTYRYKKDPQAGGMPSPVITFHDVFDVMNDKRLTRQRRHDDSYLLAEGIIGGKVVATHQVFPARRPSKIKLWVDHEGVDLKADGSDQVVVVAAVTDAKGNIKRLNNYAIRFDLEGPGSLIGNAETFTNPRQVQWGTAPIIVRSSTTPGTIKVRASVVFEGQHMPEYAEIEIPTRPAPQPLVASPTEVQQLERNRIFKTTDSKIQSQKSGAQQRLQEVENQQADFE